MEKKKKSLIKIPLYIIAIFTVGMLSGHLTFKILSFSRTVEVPDLRGKSLIEASNIARGKDLYIMVKGEDYDSYIPQGYIIRQDVPPGNTVKEGREIMVILSKGPAIKYIPDIVGQPIDTAEAILLENGIKIKKVIYVHSAEIPKNIVIAQRPEASENGGDSFSVVVSAGDYE